MTAITWTKEEIREFDRLVELASSRDQMDRIESRMEMPKFVEKHGSEKCNAMFDHLEAGGAIEAGEVMP